MYCGYCRRAGRNQRLAIQRTVNRHGHEYLYFFCRNKRDGLCPGPHVHVYQVEEAIERHYASIRFHSEFIADVSAHIDTVINEQETAARLLHKQISSQLRELDTKEENLIDLAADGTLPQTKVKTKLRDIERERQRLTQRLDTASADLTDSARLIQAALKLLETTEELYRRCNDQQRRLLNQAIFHGLYIEDDQVTDHDLHAPFGQLHALQHEHVPAPASATTTRSLHGSSKRATRPTGGPSTSGVALLLKGIHAGQGSNNNPRVELRGIEPLTFSMRTRRATNCATAPEIAGRV